LVALRDRRRFVAGRPLPDFGHAVHILDGI
jgi:hypothetical protein